MVNATIAAAWTCDMYYNLHAKLWWARWVWSLLKRFAHTAQALQDFDIPVDWDYVKSDESRTQMLSCEQQVYEPGQKCLLNTNYGNGP